MIKRDDQNQYVGVACDTCGNDAPPAKEIIGIGLEALGWHCSGGTHICPACPHPPARQFRFPNPNPISDRGSTR